MDGKIPKPSDVDAANIARPTFQQLSTEHQKALDDIQKKIREQKEKDIHRLEEEAMKQYISHFSIDRQGKVTKDENEEPVLNSEIANAIDDVVSAHVNNKLDFVGQNLQSMFDDRFSRIESHLGMQPIGSDKNVSTSNTDKAMDDSANERIPTNNALMTNLANQHNRINYNSTPHANVPYGAASSLQHSTPSNFAQRHGTPIVNRPMADDFGSSSIKDEVIKIFRQSFGTDPKGRCRSYPNGFKFFEFVKFTGDDSRTTLEHIGQFIMQHVRIHQGMVFDMIGIFLFYL